MIDSDAEVPTSGDDDPTVAEILRWLVGEVDPDLHGPGLAQADDQAAPVEDLQRSAQAYRELVAALQRDQGNVTPLLASGERLGDFVIDSLIGCGGMAIVYRARQQSLGGRPVALKVLRAAPDGVDSLSGRSFRHEAKLLAGLQHDRLAEVHGFGEERGMVFYAMSLIDGVSLREVLERRRKQRGPLLEPRLVVGWAVDISSALSVVHGAGLAHRDVKPSNIMLQGVHDVMDDVALAAAPAILVDFGLVGSTRLTKDSAELSRAATPGYAAPEQLLGTVVDGRADVFSLGVTMHDLLTGRGPEQRLSAAAGLEPLGELLPGVDADLEAVVAQAIDPDLRWRYGDGTALQADLRAWLIGDLVCARRPGRLERSRRWLRANPRLLLRIGSWSVLALLLAVTLALAGRYAGVAARANDAAADGDVLALARTLGAVPPMLRWPVLHSKTLVDLADRLAAGSDTDPLVRICERLQVEDRWGALMEAAAHVRLHGHAPLVDRMLLRALDDDQVSRRSGSAGGAESQALLVAARLFSERPAVTQDDLAATLPYRRRLRGWLDSESTPREDRLLALTALSGCGGVDDLQRVVRLAAEHSFGSEEQRLALMCARRLALRLVHLGACAEVDFERIWSQLGPVVRPLLARPGWGPSLGPWASTFAVHQAIVALLLAERSSGAPRDRTDVLPSQWLEALATGAADVGDAAILLAAAGDARVHPWLVARDGIARGRWNEWPRELGWMCAVLPDDDLAARMRGRVEAAAPDPATAVEWLYHFDDGVRGGGSQLRQGLGVSLLAAESLLGSRTESSEQALSVVALDPQGWPPQNGEPFQDGETPRAFALVPSGPAPFAWWDFEAGEPVGLWGAARGVSVRLAAVRPPPWRFVALDGFGRSRIRLSFECTAEQQGVDLVLVHQAAARYLSPFQGKVYLELRLDDEVVQGGRIVADISEHAETIPLPPLRLSPGRHSLTLGLHRASTTTYWLHGAGLRVRR